MINRTIVISHKTFFKLLFQCYLIYKFNRTNNINANRGKNIKHNVIDKLMIPESAKIHVLIYFNKTGIINAKKVKLTKEYAPN